MNKILILGGSGLVGKALIGEMNKYNEFEVYATYHKNPAPLNENRNFKLNIEDVNSMNNLLDTVKPQSIISCLRGDFDKQLTLHTSIIEYLRETGGRLYFCSTTNVFDNDFSRPHYEDDIPDSQTDYGKYKIECEKRIMEALHDNACILRLPQVWGKDSPRMKQLIKSIKGNEKVVVYPELFHNTITDVMIARKIVYIMQHDLNGIFHIVSEDTVNYKDFFSKLIKRLGFYNFVLEESFDERGYFALLSKRCDEFPEELRLNNESVINYLAN